MDTTTTTKPRASRLHKAGPPQVRHFALIEQGATILKLLDERLYATNDQIEAALFRHGVTKTGKPRQPGGAENAANRALRQLWLSGYVERVWLTLPHGPYRTPINQMAFKQHYVNILTNAGHRAVAGLYEDEGEGESSRWKRDLVPTAAGIKPHDLQVHDFLLSAMGACAASPWSIWNIKDDRQMAELKMEYGFAFETTPDGYFIISNRDTNRDYAHFLEIDLGSMTVDSAKHPDVATKIPAYGRYITGPYDADFGGLPRPIVLIVTSGPKRQQSILDAIATAHAGGAYWVSTFVDLHQHGFWGTHWRVCTEDQPRSLLDRCLA